MNSSAKGIVFFLLGGIGTLLTILAIQQMVPPAQAQAGSSDASSGLFGVGGLMADATGSGVLWVVDPAEKQLAAYACDGARTIRFVGARKIFYDLKLKSIQDNTPRAYSVDNLVLQWKKLNEEKK